MAFREFLGASTYKEMKVGYPSLQERVFTVMRDMLPNELGMELAEEYSDVKFNHSYIDYATQNIIIKMLKKKLKAVVLMVTNDDMHFCWSRYRELLFLYHGTQQGVLVEESDPKTGGSIYTIKGSEDRFVARYKVKTKFHAKAVRDYRPVVRTLT